MENFRLNALHEIFLPHYAHLLDGKVALILGKKKKKKNNNNKMGMKQQPKTNIQTYTIKQTHLDQVMHLSFYWEKNNDLTGFFKAFDPPFHIFENLKTWK